ncbi:MAG: phenylpyruvate tautomerase MIF-related protein [Verrucomicrobiia bacterium]
MLKLETTVSLPQEAGKPLLAALSKAVAGATGIPEEYVRVTVSHSAMLMSGKAGDAAFVDVRGIGGLNSETNRRLSEQICKLLKDPWALPAIGFTSILPTLKPRTGLEWQHLRLSRNGTPGRQRHLSNAIHLHNPSRKNVLPPHRS